MHFRLLACLPLLFCMGCAKPLPTVERVVVYSAQDEEFAIGLFHRGKVDLNLTLFPKFDTEANKSVSLATELMQEMGRPRCDVHWNNEPLGTIRLARAGVYEAYSFPSATWKSTPGNQHWQPFAERARVLVVNTNLVPENERPRSLLELTDTKWQHKVAMAKPQFGTTATQACCLFEVLGADTAKLFFRGLKENGVQVVAGNKQVARGVADGKFAIGLTDTDDAILEVLAGKPVAIIFPDALGSPKFDRLGTLFLPNTLAVVQGCPNPVGAKKFIDYLLQQEAVLASGGGYQIPINPAVADLVHPLLKSRRQVKAMAVDLERAADQWDEVQTFLRSEFAR
jgi:iron(III) transport system substrate-binding protein